MRLTSVAENDLDDADEDLGPKRGRMLRLSTVVHLDSRLSVRYPARLSSRSTKEAPTGRLRWCHSGRDSATKSDRISAE
jgi:hypothetical protein